MYMTRTSIETDRVRAPQGNECTLQSLRSTPESFGERGTHKRNTGAVRTSCTSQTTQCLAECLFSTARGIPHHPDALAHIQSTVHVRDVRDRALPPPERCPTGAETDKCARAGAREGGNCGDAEGVAVRPFGVAQWAAESRARARGRGCARVLRWWLWRVVVWWVREAPTPRKAGGGYCGQGASNPIAKNCGKLRGNCGNTSARGMHRAPTPTQGGQPKGNRGNTAGHCGNARDSATNCGPQPTHPQLQEGRPVATCSVGHEATCSSTQGEGEGGQARHVPLSLR